MTAPNRIEVWGCNACPFVRYAWSICGCGAAENRPIKTMSVPRWCPLRKQDHLVTLRVK